MRHQRKPARVRVGKANAPVPDIPLQEPILITDAGEGLSPGSCQGGVTRSSPPSHGLGPGAGEWAAWKAPLCPVGQRAAQLQFGS